MVRFVERRARPDVPAPASIPTGPVNELAALNILATAGVPTGPARHARTAREATEAAADLCFPIVLKVLSADIRHKSDIGGVRLGVAGRSSAEAAFDEILAAPSPASPSSPPPTPPPSTAWTSTPSSSAPPAPSP